MSLIVGTKAPDFKLPATSAQTLSLSENFKGKSLILYFYPKNFTPGCTAEACEFRDQFESFRKLDIPVLGISRDSVSSHERFKNIHKLPFDLLSDLDGKVCKSYEALIPLIKMPKRITYLLDQNHKIAGVYTDMFDSKKHIERMLQKLKK